MALNMSITESESLIHAFDEAHRAALSVAATGFASAAPSTPHKSLLLRGHRSCTFRFEVHKHPGVLLYHAVKLVQTLAERAVVIAARTAGVLIAVNLEGDDSSSGLQIAV